jgi:UTP:GlnB (protein PII) uridylyltransferase
MLTDIEHDGAIAELPLSTEIIKTSQNRRALYVAAFLHDIGKGRCEDHSRAGARIARELCPRFGLSPAETETVAWLIEHHLTMSTIAQSRDLSDPKTLSGFAAIVQSHERLKLLLLLTVADIRAVGPGVWNGWKGELLRTLYYETEPLVTGGHSRMDRRERVAAAQAAFRAALGDWPEDEIGRAINRHFPDYWLRTDVRKQVEHARHIRGAEEAKKSLAVSWTTDAFTASTELTIHAPNHPRLLSLFAGACAAAGANIVDAHITTTRDGHAIDTFRLARAFDSDEDENRRAQRISDTIESLLMGEGRLSSILAKRRPVESRIAAFTVEPEALVSNALSDRFTVVEVAGRDRPGLLYDLTSALSDLSLDISSAHVTTFGERAVDAFYVTDLTGKQITGEARQKAIRERLLAVLGAELSPAGTA